MKDEQEAQVTERLIEEIEAKQRNTVWPDTMKNGRGVDEFLWKGDPAAPRVQRIGAWIFGLFFILTSIAWLEAAFEKQSPFIGVLSVAWLLLGGKIFLNGFRRQRKPTEKIPHDHSPLR